MSKGSWIFVQNTENLAEITLKRNNFPRFFRKKRSNIVKTCHPIYNNEKKLSDQNEDNYTLYNKDYKHMIQ